MGEQARPSRQQHRGGGGGGGGGKKVVTFDLAVAKQQPLQQKGKTAGPAPNEDVAELAAENDQLRRTIAEMERTTPADGRLARLEEELAQRQQDAKVQVYKAKAAAQARIRDLEHTIAHLQCQSAKEQEGAAAIAETLKLSREWTLAESAKLAEQVAQQRSKLDDLHGELDATIGATNTYRQRVGEEAARAERLAREAQEAKQAAAAAHEEKQLAQAEVDNLRDAILAQDEFISVLEGDLIVYEAHVGLLRDSLGASKKEDRQHIKSKAFAAKLNALEVEKEEIAKRNKDQLLRTKALNVKIRCLEEERDQLLQRLRHYEREYGADRNEPIASPPQCHAQGPRAASVPVVHVAPTAQPTSDGALAAATQQLAASARELAAARAEHSAVAASLSGYAERVSLLHGALHELLSQTELPVDSGGGDQLAQLERMVSSLAEHGGRLKCERDALKEQLELARLAVSELEHVGRDVEGLKQQMDEEKRVLEGNWREVRDTLMQRERQLATVEGTRQEADARLGALAGDLQQSLQDNAALAEKCERYALRLDEMDKSLLEQMVRRGDVEHQLQAAREENAQLAATLAREKERLERLVNVLQSEIDCIQQGGAQLRPLGLFEAQPIGGAWDQQPAASPSYFERSHGSTVVGAASPPPRASKNVACQADVAPAAPEQVTCASQAVQVDTLGEELDRGRAESLRLEGLLHLEREQRLEAHEQGEREHSRLLAACEAVHAENAALRGEVTRLHAAATAEEQLVLSLRQGIAEAQQELQSYRDRDINRETEREIESTLRAVDEEFGLLERVDAATQSERTAAAAAATQSDSTATAAATTQSDPSATAGDAWSQTDVASEGEGEGTELRFHRAPPLIAPAPGDAQDLEVSAGEAPVPEALEASDAEYVEEKVAHLLLLNGELEAAVEVLNSEIWSLNARLGRQLGEHEALLAQVRVADDQLSVARQTNGALALRVEELQGQLAEAREGAAMGAAIQAEPQREDSPVAFGLEQAESQCEDGPVAFDAEAQRLSDDAAEALRSTTTTAAAARVAGYSESHTQVAILAARLVAKCSDNESLFRVNAELAHTNARLQDQIAALEGALNTTQRGGGGGEEREAERSGEEQEAERGGEEQEAEPPAVQLDVELDLQPLLVEAVFSERHSSPVLCVEAKVPAVVAKASRAKSAKSKGSKSSKPRGTKARGEMAAAPVEPPPAARETVEPSPAEGTVEPPPALETMEPSPAGPTAASASWAWGDDDGGEDDWGAKAEGDASATAPVVDESEAAATPTAEEGGDSWEW